MNFFLPRCLLVWLTVGSIAAAVARWAAADVTALRDAATFDAYLTAGAGAVLIGCAAWAWGVTTVVVACAVRDRDRSRPRDRTQPGVPGWARRVVLAACGIALVGATQGSPALATPGQIAPVTQRTEDRGPSGLGLPLPDRTTGPLREASRDRAAIGEVAATVATGALHVVRPGESLWSIATDLLAPGTDDQDIGALVARLYRANRTVIGNDPDLIQPGHRLRTPLGERPAR
ncbi:LysM peptidoglycan-binding domain-containing protein [Nocardioides sp.]|uniref:LysM peptidoglycan-binding domain-containing protein n=1 Tax=Nocardioides sp. TaxID=35761 RepID=UPI000C8E3C1C|nr:LysM peptidoglycan-binding domain-containing protein [Nocardioides sp.]MAS56044.1 hypothetical protein [Pimelobacter sp.]MDE0778135.1 LysM peptidoglycan-binding domain-containing protein [Nocardioides sp.]